MQTFMETEQENSQTFPNLSDLCKELPNARYRRGDLVAEKIEKAVKAIPLRITEVIRPETDKRKRSFYGFCYRVETVFPEDGYLYLTRTEVPIPEELLIPFDDVKENVIGALLSKAAEIRDLTCKKETRWDI